MPVFVRKNVSRILTVLYALLLFSLNFIRIFDNNFWGDEAYTIRLARMPLLSMFAETAGDVHPPLYYILVKLIGGILGYQGAVFHLISLIPYGVILVLALTVIWEQYGKPVSLMLITLASLLPTAVQYNVEVRMYSWGALFVLLSYMFLRRMLSQNRLGCAVGFVLFSLAAAYTHYYCLISVAFFYLALIVTALLNRRAFLKKTLLICAVTVVGYLPWFFTLLQTLERTANDFWMMWIPTLRESIAYFFSGQGQYLLFAILMMSAAAFLLYQIRSSGAHEADTSSEAPVIRLHRAALSADTIWVLAGLCSMFGTVLVGIAVSRLIRPLFIVRYLYPVSVTAWLLLGFCLSKLRGRIVYTAAVLGIVLLTGIPQYCAVCQSDRSQNESLQATLSATAGRIETGDIILTDLAPIDWTVSDYYYPDVPHQLIDWNSLPNLRSGTEYWLILDDTSAQENVSLLNAQSCCPEEIVSHGILGTSQVSIYRLYIEQP